MANPFHNEQIVQHAIWRDDSGNPARGIVRTFDLSTKDRAAGCADTEVAWQGIGVADELDLVADQIKAVD